MVVLHSIEHTKRKDETKEKTKRTSVDEQYMLMTKVIALRSTCLRHKFGCVITKNNKIVSTGYNGAVKRGKHCLDVGCIRDKLGIESGTKIEICSGVHAEQNALLQAGKNADGGVLYVNKTPCKPCSKMIINAGINKVVIPANDEYLDKEGLELMKSIGIEIVEWIPNETVIWRK